MGRVTSVGSVMPRSWHHCEKEPEMHAPVLYRVLRVVLHPQMLRDAFPSGRLKEIAGGGSGFRFLTMRAIVTSLLRLRLRQAHFLSSRYQCFFRKIGQNRPRRPVITGSGLTRPPPDIPPTWGRLDPDFSPSSPDRFSSYRQSSRHRSGRAASVCRRLRFVRRPAHRRSSGPGRRDERAGIPDLPVCARWTSSAAYCPSPCTGAHPGG